LRAVYGEWRMEERVVRKWFKLTSVHPYIEVGPWGIVVAVAVLVEGGGCN